MKNSKWMRFLLIVVSVAMVLSLFACGDKRGNEGETTTAAPEGTTAAPENTTVAGGETTTVAGGETTTVAGGETTTVAGGETTVAGGETTTVAGGETTVAGGEDTTVAGGEDTTVAGGEDTTVAGGEDTTVAGGEDTTVAPDDVYAGNWHASVDVFLADVDGNLGDNVLAGDFSAVDTVIANANTNNHRGTTIIDVANVEYPSVNASCVFFGVGWIAVDGYDVENFVCNVYDADGNVLKTVALGLTDAEIGVVEHVSNNMNYAAGTVAHRLTVNLEAELIDLSDYDGQTVKVVYSIDVATTEYTIDLIEIEVVVPEAPAGEDTTVDGGEDTNVAGGEDTTVAGGEDTTVAGGEDTTVAGGEDTTVDGGEDTTVAGGEDTTVAGGEDTTVAGGEDTTVAGGEDTTNAPAEDTTVAPPEPIVPGDLTGSNIAGLINAEYYSATVNADGSVTITNTVGSTADEALNITPYALSTQYVVIKYKATTNATITILATTGTNEIGGYYLLKPVADGAWHTAIIDLNNISAGYTVGDPVAFFRIDLCEEEVGQSITIDSIKFVDDIDNVAGELAGKIWQLFAALKADGVAATVNGTSQDAGPMQNAAVNGTVLDFDGTWVAVSGHSAFKGLSYTVVDSEGNVTTAPLSIGNERTDVSTHVINNNGYDPATKGYALPNIINLSKWANQTVTLSFNLILDDAGHSIVVYVATVNVGDEVKEPIPGYADGETIKSIVSNGYTTTLNGDGSITVTQSGGADGAINLQSLAAAGTPKYVLIKYKTTDTAEIIIYATTAGQSHKENYVTLKTDGAWHIVAVDLEAVGSYVAGDVISLFRFDFNEGAANAGKSVTFDFIRLVDNPSEVELEPGEKIVYSIASKNNIDFLYADGNEATNLKSSSTITATTVKYVGWLAVAKKDLTGVSYVVTDADGETTTVALEASEEAANKFLKGADPIQAAVSNLGEGTVGYTVNFTADLSAWAGQTVSLSVVAEAVDGVVAETYSVVVNVPAAQ